MSPLHRSVWKVSVRNVICFSPLIQSVSSWCCREGERHQRAPPPGSGLNKMMSFVTEFPSSSSSSTYSYSISPTCSSSSSPVLFFLHLRPLHPSSSSGSSTSSCSPFFSTSSSFSPSPPSPQPPPPPPLPAPPAPPPAPRATDRGGDLRHDQEVQVQADDPDPGASVSL